MAQNSGSSLASPHGYSAYNARLPSSSTTSSSKRIGNGLMSFNHSSNASMSSNISMGPMKPSTANINSTDKSNSMPYTSRYARKMWPMSRSFQEKNFRSHDEHDSSYPRSGVTTHTFPAGENSSFTVEPSADDDDGDGIRFSTRHTAAARFQRNQRLFQEIFNEVCIPDLRLNVNVDRILALRRQVHTLETHRETFEKDLNELEENHVTKKRKFLEANEKFYDEYKEAISTDLSEKKIDEIKRKYEKIEKLQKEKQLLIQQQQQTVPAALPTQLPMSTTHPTTSVTTKDESESTTEIPLQHISTPSVISSIQTPLAQSQSETSQVSSLQSTSSQSQISPPVIQHTPSIQSSQSMSQNYPIMQTNNSYGHFQQTQYRSQMTQRPTSYPANVQWSTNTYDPRYYNSYPANAQWSQQPHAPSMRGPFQQSSPMYSNSTHYGYNNTNPTWNSGSNPYQQYAHSQNSSNDHTYTSAPPLSSQMHNPPHSNYDYESTSQQYPQQ